MILVKVWLRGAKQLPDAQNVVDTIETLLFLYNKYAVVTFKHDLILCIYILQRTMASQQTWRFVAVLLAFWIVVMLWLSTSVLQTNEESESKTEQQLLTALKVHRCVEVTINYTSINNLQQINARNVKIFALSVTLLQFDNLYFPS